MTGKLLLGSLVNLKPFFFDLVSHEHLDQIPDGYQMKGPINNLVSLCMHKKNSQINVWLVSDKHTGLDSQGFRTDVGFWYISFPFVPSFNKEAMFNAWKLLYFEKIPTEIDASIVVKISGIKRF